MSVRVVRRRKELDKVHAAHRIRDGVRIVAELGQLLANELLVVGLLLGFGRHGRSRGEPAVANGVHKEPVRRGSPKFHGQATMRRRTGLRHRL